MGSKKKILLLGDSVRINYQNYVALKLKEEADVYFPSDNGRFCQYTLKNIWNWWNELSNNGEIKFDVVHFNCGLWDVIRLKVLEGEEDSRLTTPCVYRESLIKIFKSIKKLCPTAKIVFALSTSVKEPANVSDGSGYRKNSDIQEYNRIAIEVFEEVADEVEINDLWTISVNVPDTFRSDVVHFDTEQGKEMLGHAVVECCRRLLNEKIK